jgi:hypothetical protein
MGANLPIPTKQRMRLARICCSTDHCPYAGTCHTADGDGQDLRLAGLLVLRSSGYVARRARLSMKHC